MKIRFSPIGWNDQCGIDAFPDTEFEYIGEDSVKIDGNLYEFDGASIFWPDISKETGGAILEAHRNESGEIEMIVRRFYTGDCPYWDTGGYHAFGR